MSIKKVKEKIKTIYVDASVANGNTLLNILKNKSVLIIIGFLLLVYVLSFKTNVATDFINQIKDSIAKEYIEAAEELEAANLLLQTQNEQIAKEMGRIKKQKIRIVNENKKLKIEKGNLENKLKIINTQRTEVKPPKDLYEASKRISDSGINNHISNCD